MKRMSICLSAAILTVAGALTVPAQADQLGRWHNGQSQNSREVVFGQKKKGVQPNSPLETVRIADMEDFTTLANRPVKQKPESTLTRSAQTPQGQLYMLSNHYMMAPSYSGAFGALDLSKGRFFTTYTGSQFMGTNDMDWEYQGGTVRGDYMYISNYHQDMVTNLTAYAWKVVDLTTGELVQQYELGSDYDKFFYQMTYDSARDVIWALGLSVDQQSAGRLIRIDCNGSSNPGDWKYTYIGDAGASGDNFAATLTYNPADQLIYFLHTNGMLDTFNPDGTLTTDGTKVNLISVWQFDRDIDPYCFPSWFTNAPTLVYSPRDKAFFGTYHGENGVTLFGIDAKTYETFNVANITPWWYPNALFCFDNYVVGNAPDQVSNLKVQFTDNSLSGTISFTMPSTNFDGVAYPAGKRLKVKGLNNETEVLFEGEYAAGVPVTVNQTLKQGLYNLTIVCTDGDVDGASNINRRFWVGNDYPTVPQQVTLDEMTLYWYPCTSIGTHGGYVNTQNLSYNVYNNGKKVNSEPIQAYTFTLPMPEKFSRHNITVTAIHDGLESEHSPVISRAVGPALQLPLEIEPTAAQADLFDQIDVNGDYNGEELGKFIFKNVGGQNYMYLKTIANHIKVKDYLIMPKFHIENANSIYSLSFLYKSSGSLKNTFNRMNIILRRTFNGSSDDKVIYTIMDEDCTQPRTVTALFKVDEPGDYYIAFFEDNDGKPLPDNGVIKEKYVGAQYANLRLEQIPGDAAKAPSELLDVVPGCAPNGLQTAVFSFKAPSLDLSGNAIPADSKIKVTATCGSNVGSTEVLPGQTGTVEVSTEKNGFSEVVLQPSIGEAMGLYQTFNVYTGLDTPGSITDISHLCTDDNMQMDLTWGVPAVGANGGYVNPKDFKFNVYQKNGQLSYKYGSVTDPKFSFRVASSKQANYYVGASAENEMGESTYNLFTMDVLGAPYQLPISEDFSAYNSAFRFSPWTANNDDPFADSQWDHATSYSGLVDVVLNGGSLYCTAKEGYASAKGELRFPKISTAGVPRALLSIMYLDFPLAPDMELWIRTSKDQTPKKVASKKPTRGITQFKNFDFQFTDELLDCAWVQPYLRVNFTSADQYFIVDDIEITQNVDNDFKLYDISGPTINTVGDTPEFTITATNSGVEAGRCTVLAELVGDGKVLASKEVNTGRLQPTTSYSLRASFPMAVDYLNCDKLIVRGTVTSADDQVANNNVKDFEIELNKHELPIVSDLKADWDPEGDAPAVLTWSEPALGIDGRFGFEAAPRYGLHDKIGGWSNVDLDGQVPFAAADNGGAGNPLQWEDYDQPGAWQVITPAEWGMVRGDRIYPHSGQNVAIARSAAYNESAYEDPIPVADWLISPEVKGGTKVSFWMSTLSTIYPETITVFYSDGSNTIPTGNGVDELRQVNGAYTCGDFKSIRHFTKSGSEDWEFLEFTLPANAKYFAIVYRSIGGFGAVIDDITYTPAGNDSWTLDSFDLVSVNDGKQTPVQLNLNQTSYSLKNPAGSYAIVTNVHNDSDEYYQSPYGNLVTLGTSGVSGVLADGASVFGGKRQIILSGLNGKLVSIYSTDGKLMSRLNVSSDNMAVACDAGIFIVRVEDSTAKVVVK
ncbi:MAG: DUF6383 domain-containing protein [Muribaculum sp.]|nr:DUF6383 domain-containing protein [Muribaculum sp.]